MLKKSLVSASVLAASLVGASSAFAGGYVGGSVGYSDFPDDFDSSISFQATGGYRVNDNFAIEASYVYLGEAEDEMPPIWTAEVTGLNFSAVGLLPVSSQVDLFAKIGMFKWELDIAEEGYGKVGTDDGTDLSLGLGAAYQVSRDFSVVGEIQRFQVDGSEGKLNNFSVGFRVNF